eukprot:4879795-Prorocentrum_lima.AAC.1
MWRKLGPDEQQLYKEAACQGGIRLRNPHTGQWHGGQALDELSLAAMDAPPSTPVKAASQARKEA